MAKLPSKQALKAELVTILTSDLETLERVQMAAQEGATHAEAKSEGDKDTRATEQSYLARGQALRVQELRIELSEVLNMAIPADGKDNPVGLGALVTVEEDGTPILLFMAPQCGGTKLAAGRVQVVTPKSPLGSALLGLRAGDDFQVPLAKRIRELTVLHVV